MEGTLTPTVGYEIGESWLPLFHDLKNEEFEFHVLVGKPV
ncbi:hypothetical protein SDC9_186982 [bioreactor metagenome]|uniref:Uncharacterized protein n=1 Tax=bioreactor metagenome TaxID=1076179 RepID=A0A645HTH3_9ZZZZ